MSMSVPRSHSQVAEDKRIDVCRLLDAFCRFACSVARFCVDSNQDRVTAGLCMLQRGCIFERMRGNNPIIVIGCGDKRRGVFPALAHIMNRRVSAEHLELFLVLAGSVVS